MAVERGQTGIRSTGPDAATADMFWKVPLPPDCIQLVDSVDSEAFSRLSLALENSIMISMDAEWKPIFDKGGSACPRVSILQIACRLHTYQPRKFWKGHKRKTSKKTGNQSPSLMGSKPQADLASMHGLDEEIRTRMESIQIEIHESDGEGDLDLHQSGQIQGISVSRSGSDEEDKSSSSSEIVHSASEDIEGDTGRDRRVQQIKERRGKSSGTTNAARETSSMKKEPSSTSTWENRELKPRYRLSPELDHSPEQNPRTSSREPREEVSPLSSSPDGAGWQTKVTNASVRKKQFQEGNYEYQGLEQDPTTLPEMIFILDLLALPLAAISDMLKAVFVDARILKIGFGFKQDLIALRGTFPGPDSHGCFDKVEPYLDVRKLYQHLYQETSSFIHRGKKVVIGGDGLASISEAILGLPLAKDMQCSNWEQRPLTSEQFDYAAADAYCLLAIVDVLQVEFAKSWFSPTMTAVVGDDEDVLPSGPKVGVAGILTAMDKTLFGHDRRSASLHICHPKRGIATLMVEAALEGTGFCVPVKHSSILNTVEIHVTGKKILGIEVLVHRLGEKLLIGGEQNLTGKRVSRKARSRRAKDVAKNKKGVWDAEDTEYIGTPPWNTAVGGNGIPKFLCDAMVEGLARQLRCVGIDAASPNSKKCEPRELVELAEKEGRIILTRDVKFLQRRFVPTGLAYRVRRQGKWEQLAEILQTFKLSISEDQLLSRCTKCNGGFKRKPLNAKEAVAQGHWNQVIPASALESVDTFWICSVCKHIYWQGFQFNRAYQQFAAICQAEEQEI